MLIEYEEPYIFCKSSTYIPKIRRIDTEKRMTCV